MEEISLEDAIEELKRHKANETDHYRDCGRCSRALDVAIKCLEKENNKSFEEINEEMMEKYLTRRKIIEIFDFIRDKMLE